MDPIAHTFTGAALAAAGLRRVTPLATAALVIGANAPDVDVVAMFGADYVDLAWRRGWTHGVLALALWPFVITGALLLWARWRGAGARVRAGPLLAVSAVAVVSHPTLDWLNNYGMRWLMPFDGQWFYGDALFIVDPWTWLALGGMLFLRNSRTTAACSLWAGFWLLGTWLVLTTALVPLPAKIVWIGSLAALLAARVRRCSPGDSTAAATLACVAVYMAAAAAASAAARGEVRAALAVAGVGPVEAVMVGPVAANPFAGTVVAATPTAYHLGQWNWLDEPRFARDPEPIERHSADPAIAAAASTPAARRFLTWSRFPYYEVERTDGSIVVKLRDARYRDLGRLVGPDVPLDGSMRPLHAPP